MSGNTFLDRTGIEAIHAWDDVSVLRGGLTVKTKSMKIRYFYLYELAKKGWDYITGNIKNYRLS